MLRLLFKLRFDSPHYERVFSFLDLGFDHNFFLSVVANFFLVLFFAALLFSLLFKSVVPFVLLIVFLLIVLDVPNFLFVFKSLRGVSDALVVFPFLVSLLVSGKSFEVAVRECCEGFSSWFSDLLVKASQRSLVRGGSVRSNVFRFSRVCMEHSKPLGKAFLVLGEALDESSVSRRNFLLDRAVRSFYSSLVSEMRGFSSRLASVSLLVFVFGAAAPLIFISFVPLLGSLFGVSPVFVVLGLLFFSLVIVVLFSRFVFFNSPVIVFSGFPVVFVSKFFWAGFLVFLFFSLAQFFGLFSFLLSGFSVFLFGLFFSVALTCFLVSRVNKRLVYESKLLERDLVLVLHSISSAVGEGKPFELVLKSVGDNFDDPWRSKLLNAFSIVKRGGSVRSAFFGVRGVLSDCLSLLVKNCFSFLVKSLGSGSRVFSFSVSVLASELDEFFSVREDFLSRVSQAVSMLSLTLFFFAPLIIGLIVNINGLVENSLSGVLVSFGFSRFLDLVLGVYLFFLSVLLTGFITIIRSGFSLWDFFDSLWRVLLSSITVYLLSLFVGGLIFY